jgi:hypothetical protein
MAIWMLESQRTQQLLSPRGWKPQNKEDQWCGTGLRMKDWKLPGESLV